MSFAEKNGYQFTPSYTLHISLDFFLKTYFFSYSKSSLLDAQRNAVIVVLMKTFVVASPTRVIYIRLVVVLYHVV